MINGARFFISKWAEVEINEEYKFFPGFCFVKRVPLSEKKHWIYVVIPYLPSLLGILSNFSLVYISSWKNVIQMKKKERRELLSM